MAYGQTVNYIDWGGGVNPNAGDYLLAEDQAKDARNMHTTPIGSLKKREGFVSLATPTANLDSIHSLAAVNGLSTIYLLAAGKQAGASNDRIISINSSGTAATLKSTLTQGKRWEWAQAPISGGQGPMYGMNGTDTPQYWDGAGGAMANWTATTGTVPTGARFLIYHTDRLWATGDITTAANTGRVWYSGLTASAVPGPDPRNWDTDGYVDIEPQDGSPITGIGEVGPYICVFKPRNTYVITDPVTGAWRQISDEIGCIAHRTIQETTQGTLFLSEDLGVCRTDGSTLEVLSDNVQPILRAAAEDFPTALPYSCATFYRNSYFISIPWESATNDILLEYDFDTKSWWIHTQASNQFALIDPVGTPKLYSADPSTCRVSRGFVPNTYTDNATAFESYYTTGYLTWGEPHLNKRVNQFRMDGAGNWALDAATSFDDEYDTLDYQTLNFVPAQTVTPVVEPDTDFGVEDAFGGIGTFGQAPAPSNTIQPAISENAYFTPGFGRAWSLKITDDSAYALEIFSLAAFLRGRTD